MDGGERHCVTIRATHNSPSYTLSETECDIPLDEDKYENDDTYNEIETTAAFSSLHVLYSDSSMSVNSEEYLTVERNLDKLYVAYLSLKPVEEIANSKIFQINQEQYFAILNGLKMVKDVKNEVKNVSLKSVNEDMMRLSTAEVLINVLHNTVGTNFKNSPDVYLEDYLVHEMITLYNCVGRIVRYFYEIIKQTHSAPSQHSSIAIAVQKSETVTQTLSVQTNNNDLDLDLEKLQEEYHDLSTTISLLKSIVEDTPNSVSNIRITQASNDLLGKMESEYSYSESEKTHKKVTDVTGARKCILECLSELAKVRNYCQNSEMNTAVQVSLKSSEIKCCKTRCCKRNHKPHIHAKLNGIPIVINMRQVPCFAISNLKRRILSKKFQDIEDIITFVEELQQPSREEVSSNQKHKKAKIKLHRETLRHVSKHRCPLGGKTRLYKFIAYHNLLDNKINNLKIANCSKNRIQIKLNYIKHAPKLRSNKMQNLIKQYKPLQMSDIPPPLLSLKYLDQKLAALIDSLLTPVLPSMPQLFEVRIMADFSDEDMPMGMRQGRRTSNRSKYYDYPEEMTTYYPPRPTIVKGNRRSSVVPHRHGESQLASQPWAPFVTSDTSLPTMADKNKDPKGGQMKNPQNTDSGIGTGSGMDGPGPGPGDMWNPSRCFFCQMQAMSICKTCTEFLMGMQRSPFQCCDKKQACKIDATTSCHSSGTKDRSDKTCETPKKVFVDAKTECVSCLCRPQDKNVGTLPKTMNSTSTSYHDRPGDRPRTKSETDNSCCCLEVVHKTSSKKLANKDLRNSCVPSCHAPFDKKTLSNSKVPKRSPKLKRYKGTNVSFPDLPSHDGKKSKVASKKEACGCGCNTPGCSPHTSECMKLLNTRNMLPSYMGPPTSFVDDPRPVCRPPSPNAQRSCPTSNTPYNTNCHLFTYLVDYPPLPIVKSPLQPTRDQHDVRATKMNKVTTGGNKRRVPSWEVEERSPCCLRSVISLLQLVKYFADSFIEPSKQSIIPQDAIIEACSERDIRSTSCPDISKIKAVRDQVKINFSRNYSSMINDDDAKKKKYVFGNTTLSTEEFQKSTWSKWKSMPCITITNRIVDFKILDLFLKFLSQDTINFGKGNMILQGDSQKEICFIQTPKQCPNDESDSEEEDEGSVEELKDVPQRSGMLTMTHNPAFHVNFDNSLCIACSRNLEDIILDFSDDDAF